VIDAKNKEILDVYGDSGTAHDFRMFKESIAESVPTHIIAVMDSGYQGVNQYLPFALIPVKSSKHHPLTEDDKEFNAALAKFRVVIEHINRHMKIFRICKETYRGKGKRGLIRVSIIASLYNHRCVA